MNTGITIDWKRVILISLIVWVIQGTYTTLNTGLFQQLSGVPTRWLAISIYSGGTALTWAIFTPLIFWIIVRSEYLLKGIFQIALYHIIIGIVISSAQRYMTVILTYNMILWTEAVDLSLLKWENFMGYNFIRQVGNSIVVYLVITCILYGYLYYIKSQNYIIERSQLESKLSKARLESLKYQFQPHFLFNSLQSISTLMHRDIREADQSLGDLSELLRHSIKTIDIDKITLGEELFHLQKYIDLQKMRYQDKLSSNIQFDKALIDIKVPPFILQPIVENSVKHGIEESGSTINISIAIVQEGNKLVIHCKDDGLDIKQDTPSSGLGLKNLQSRLDALYLDQAELNYGSISAGGYWTTIIIPISY